MAFAMGNPIGGCIAVVAAIAIPAAIIVGWRRFDRRRAARTGDPSI